MKKFFILLIVAIVMTFSSSSALAEETGEKSINITGVISPCERNCLKWRLPLPNIEKGEGWIMVIGHKKIPLNNFTKANLKTLNNDCQTAKCPFYLWLCGNLLVIDKVK